MSAAGQVRVVGVVAEHRAEGLGLGTRAPRLSWRTETDLPAWVQATYEVGVTRLDGGGPATYGPIDSAESVLVAVAGHAARRS